MAADPNSFSVKEIVISIEAKVDNLTAIVSGKVGRREMYTVITLIVVGALFRG